MEENDLHWSYHVGGVVWRDRLEVERDVRGVPAILLQLFGSSQPTYQFASGRVFEMTLDCHPGGTSSAGRLPSGTQSALQPWDIVTRVSCCIRPLFGVVCYVAKENWNKRCWYLQGPFLDGKKVLFFVLTLFSRLHKDGRHCSTLWHDQLEVSNFPWSSVSQASFVSNLLMGGEAIVSSIQNNSDQP